MRPAWNAVMLAALAAAIRAAPAVADALPNAAHTPGALNPQVTQRTIGSTICKRDWLDAVRPSRAYLDAIKGQQLARGPYAVAHARLQDYEEDHRLPIALGGAPWWSVNLWPQPKAEKKRKDELEERLHRRVCAHQMSLEDAQAVFLGNWLR
jgi:hypothetical protein